jgi:hypothetical protein
MLTGSLPLRVGLDIVKKGDQPILVVRDEGRSCCRDRASGWHRSGQARFSSCWPLTKMASSTTR